MRAVVIVVSLIAVIARAGAPGTPANKPHGDPKANAVRACICSEENFQDCFPGIMDFAISWWKFKGDLRITSEAEMKAYYENTKFFCKKDACDATADDPGWMCPGDTSIVNAGNPSIQDNIWFKKLVVFEEIWHAAFQPTGVAWDLIFTLIDNDQPSIDVRGAMKDAATSYRDVEAKSWMVFWIDDDWDLGGGTTAEEKLKKEAMKELAATLQKSLSDLEKALARLEELKKSGAANDVDRTNRWINRWTACLRKGKKRLERLKELLG